MSQHSSLPELAPRPQCRLPEEEAAEWGRPMGLCVCTALSGKTGTF